MSHLEDVQYFENTEVIKSYDNSFFGFTAKCVDDQYGKCSDKDKPRLAYVYLKLKPKSKVQNCKVTVRLGGSSNSEANLKSYHVIIFNNTDNISYDYTHCSDCSDYLNNNENLWKPVFADKMNCCFTGEDNTYNYYCDFYGGCGECESIDITLVVFPREDGLMFAKVYYVSILDENGYEIDYDVVDYRIMLYISPQEYQYMFMQMLSQFIIALINMLIAIIPLIIMIKIISRFIR